MRSIIFEISGEALLVYRFDKYDADCLLIQCVLMVAMGVMQHLIKAVES